MNKVLKNCHPSCNNFKAVAQEISKFAEAVAKGTDPKRRDLDMCELRALLEFHGVPNN